MATNINIITAVDVIAALSDGTLDDNIYMVDNSPWESTGQGTTELSTACVPGQTIQWISYAIDLQTPVSIKSITFIGEDSNGDVVDEIEETDTAESRPDLNSWTGFVPYNLVPGALYKYRLGLQMGDGKNSIMYVDTPSLKRAY